MSEKMDSVQIEQQQQSTTAVVPPTQASTMTTILSYLKDKPPPEVTRDPITQAQIIPPPPDGGWASWSQVLGAHLVVFLNWGIINSFGVFQTYYTTNGISSPSNISWIGSMLVFWLMFMGAYSGSLSDAGYSRAVLSAGMFLYVLGIFMMSLCQTFWQFLLAQGICVGMANGLMFIPVSSIVSSYFGPRKRSLALAVMLCGAATGGMIIPISLDRLFVRIGFAWSMRCYGLISVVFSIIAQLLLKKRLPPKDSIGFLEVEALKDRVFVVFAVGCFVVFLGIHFAFFYVSAYARNILGLTFSQSIPVILVINGTGIPGRLLPMWLADKYFRPIHVSIPIDLLSGILLWAWIGVKTLPGLYGFAAVYGCSAAGLQALFPATLADLTLDPTRLGSRMGWGFSIASFATLIGPPLGGLLVQTHGGNYLYAQIFAGLAVVCGTLIILLASLLQKRMKQREVSSNA